jgi:hypothetical protein
VFAGGCQRFAGGWLDAKYRFRREIFRTFNARQFLQRVFEEVVYWATDHSGITIAADQLEFDIYDNPRGRPNYQGKIGYHGPVSPTSSGWPKIKLDLTADERLVLLIAQKGVSSLQRPSGGRDLG